MVIVPSAVVAHGHVLHVQVLQDVLDGLALQWRACDGVVQVIHVALMVLAVVDLHRTSIDMRLKCIEGVGKGRKFKCHL